jgi:hypothetical protein
MRLHRAFKQDKLFQFGKEIGFLKNQIHPKHINNSKQIHLHCESEKMWSIFG